MVCSEACWEKVDAALGIMELRASSIGHERDFKVILAVDHVRLSVDSVPVAIDDVVMSYVEQVMNGEDKQLVRKRLHSKVQKPEKTKLLKSGVEEATATIRASEHAKTYMKIFDREVSFL